ncbi:unnamed protein product [Schistosoma mattheei]|uniref:Uncharacterized protein n=1 Tax=Schistosoma mattheei TaxID=31246 RepID=A0A183PGI4_9TREM|nr:unnamed protein product [Schistosoma mattheei]
MSYRSQLAEVDLGNLLVEDKCPLNQFNEDPYEDQFAKLSQAKKERRAKNELQRLRNIARTVKAGQAPPIGVLTESQSSKTELSRAFAIAQNSDASMGRFSTPVDSRKLSKKVEKRSKKRIPLSQVVQSTKKSKQNKLISRTTKKNKMSSRPSKKK